MKSILLLLLIIPFMMRGQDTIHGKTDTLYIGDGLPADSLTYPYFRSTSTSITIVASTIIYDTIPVIMLVCDTSYNPLSTMTVYVDTQLGIPGYMEGRYNYVWWQFGYGVRKILAWNKYYRADDFYKGCTVVAYLDDKRKPLPPSIIVWMSREIE